MKVKLFVIVSFLIFVCPVLAIAGKSYYVDPNASYDGDGSYLKPWKYISTVNKYSFNTGDDVYFKANTKIVADAYLNVDWDGSESDYVIIGAYYGENKFGLNGLARPIIDGNGNTVPANTTYVGLITKNSGSGFVQIKDLNIQNSGKYSILCQMVKNITIKNCYSYKSWENGFMVASVDTGLIENNTVEYPRVKGVGPGAAIEVTGGDKENTCKNVKVKNNVVFHAIEGIGIYKKAEYVTVENNTAYDCDSVMIYVDASKNIEVINNIVYSSGDSSKWGGPATGIAINNEKYRPYCFTGPIRVTGNKIAGCSFGISVGCEESKDDPTCSWKDVLIDNNIIIDSTQYNIRFWDASDLWMVHFENNFSFVYSLNSKHCSEYSPAGVTWNKNVFSSKVSGDASYNATIEDALIKRTGWQSLPAGGVDLAYFSFNDQISISFDSGLTNSSSNYSEINILPLGDSITANIETKSYRYYLWNMLTSDGYNTNFIGSQKYQIYENFDPDHEGHSGWRADQIADSLGTWLRNYTPDVVLLHIGHNDFFQGQSVDSTIIDIEKIIDILQSNNPKVIVLLAQIIYPNWVHTKYEELNLKIPLLASRKSTNNSVVIPVNQMEYFNPEEDTYDGAHPNESGNLKIAKQWYKSLIPTIAQKMETTIERPKPPAGIKIGML